MKAIGIIPARWGSSRFPGKPLAPLLGKPLIQWVYEGACQSKLLADVVVATDDARVYQAVLAFGGQARMTSPRHRSGSERVAEVAKTLRADFIVNIQGDEPLITGEDIDAGLEILKHETKVGVATLATRFVNLEEVHDPDTCKLVLDQNAFALYFSRTPIPFVSPNHLDTGALPIFNKHVGIYFFKREVLFNFVNLPVSPLEELEKLEQLRLLENGIAIKVIQTRNTYFAVDSPKHVTIVETYLNKRAQSGR